jgi:Zn-dependent M28 family amino/carboxypeptidase
LIVDSNDKVNYVSAVNFYYQSNNVVAVLKGMGGQNESLLISSHFDSTPVSHGATDDGIGASAMLSTIKALLVSPTLEKDIVFLFNNAEEPGLLGGTFISSNIKLLRLQARRFLKPQRRL